MPAPSVSDPTAGGGASWRPADPGPLGLAAFAMTTFVLSMFKANLVGVGGEAVVFPLALAYGGIAQLLAGMWEFRTGNTFGAVAFTSFGAFWISFFVLVQVDASQLTAAEAGKGIGLYEWAWAIFTLYMFVASLRTSAAVSLVFFLLTITFILLAIGDSGAHVSVTHAGGFVGLATAVAAWYASFAAVINSTFQRTVLPVFPLGPKVRAL
jgi:succinate-acetate transporter protein